MSDTSGRKLKIGLAVGEGTGPELTGIFKKVILFLSQHHKLGPEIEFLQAPRTYHSYLSLLQYSSSQENRDEEILRDTAHYEKYCKDAATAHNISVIFRTAITAQSLYLVRLHLMAIKVELFQNPSDIDNVDAPALLLVRDQAQGFYTGSNISGGNDNETLTRSCQFSKSITGRIVAYSLKHARSVWGQDVEIKEITMVYKHHLFNGIFDVWASEWSKAIGIPITFIQPDTFNRNLLAFGITGKKLVIAGNEYADIMEILFLQAFSMGPQETSYNENVYLHPDLGADLSEYQTTHGSADDLTGKNLVNPSATIRAAAAILERHGKCRGTERVVDEVLNGLVGRGYVTPDQGGGLSTSEFVEVVMKEVGDLVVRKREERRGVGGGKIDFGGSMVALKAKL